MKKQNFSGGGYCSPAIEAVEIDVEQGFATTGGGGGEPGADDNGDPGIGL